MDLLVKPLPDKSQMQISKSESQMLIKQHIFKLTVRISVQTYHKLRMKRYIYKKSNWTKVCETLVCNEDVV